MLPTVSEVLALDAFTPGAPVVVVGGAALEASVRWVHVSDSADVARLLEGGELLLSTGSGWPDDPRRLALFVAQLAEVGAAGIVSSWAPTTATCRRSWPTPRAAPTSP